MGLFQPIPNTSAAADTTRPLADRMRPRTLDEYVGQEHLVGPASRCARRLSATTLDRMIFWGPPGTGKTTLAQDHRAT